MTTKAKLFLSSLAVVAFAASPAMAKKHHAPAYRSQTERVAAPVIGWEGAYANEPGYRLPTYFGAGMEDARAEAKSQLLHRGYDGYEHDRQLVGLHYN